MTLIKKHFPPLYAIGENLTISKQKTLIKIYSIRSTSLYNLFFGREKPAEGTSPNTTKVGSWGKEISFEPERPVLFQIRIFILAGNR